MTAPAAQAIQRAMARRRWTVTPALELLVLVIAAGIGIASYYVLRSDPDTTRLIPPALIALLLVANILPGVIILMLIGRRIARRRAALSLVGGGGQLHVRLVAIFSILSAVPMLLVAVVASLLFQYGIQFWYSGQARTVFENAIVLTRQSYNLILDRYEQDAFAMAGDLGQEIAQAPARGLAPAVYLRSPTFDQFYVSQIFVRSLSEGALFVAKPGGQVQLLAAVNPYAIDLSRLVSAAAPRALADLRAGRRSAVVVTSDRIQIFTRLPGSTQLYVYAGRVTEQRTMNSQFELAKQASASYHKLLTRARALQLRFNAGLLAASLLIVGIAVWIALAIADRLVRPVGELVAAARAVEGGDLTARVPDPRSRDEVGTLAKAFNQMTGRLEQQNADLLAANNTLENRRALIEAVMGGVSAGVVATAPDGTVRIANASAARLLGTDGAGPVGKPLAAVAPELEALIGGEAREAVVQVAQRQGGATGGERTLAVRIARTDAGPILTFDDITQQVQDQRRAAWADVARRIAHEIKNPLTPIQLAAERLQRRYGGQVEAGDTTFARLTDTIVRQVGDLRRMVDEFSSFARMPKPVFRPEAVLDIARQSLFLHEVAHPQIRFDLAHSDPAPTMTCDRRQLGQAFTNLVKNAVEAIEAKRCDGGEIAMALFERDGRIIVSIADNGIGLPAERDRILEPYMTTRARGTGLGLAIVAKIVEEHRGTMTFADRDGGTIVTLSFDPAALDDGGTDDARYEPAVPDGQLATLTRNRT